MSKRPNAFNVILGHLSRENSAACARFTRKDKLNMYSIRVLPAFLSSLQEMKLRYQAQESGGRRRGRERERDGGRKMRIKLMSCGKDREK